MVAENNEPEKILHDLNDDNGLAVKMTTIPIRLYEDFSEEILGVDKIVSQLRLGMFSKPQTMVYTRADLGHPGEQLSHHPTAYHAKFGPDRCYFKVLIQNDVKHQHQ